MALFAKEDLFQDLVGQEGEEGSEEQGEEEEEEEGEEVREMETGLPAFGRKPLFADVSTFPSWVRQVAVSAQ